MRGHRRCLGVRDPGGPALRTPRETPSGGAPLDLEAWPRREHFELFRTFDEPFFDIATDVDASGSLARAHERPGTMFLDTLYWTLDAANRVEEFRLRIRDEQVWRHDRVHGGCTILRDDDSFAFAYVDFDPDFEAFVSTARETIGAVRRGSRGLDPNRHRDDLVYVSVVPWIRFTAVSHPRRSAGGDSIPKVVFGRRFERHGVSRMPVAVQANHALMDGIHVARFLENLEAGLRR